MLKLKGVFIINILRKGMVHLRTSIKLIIIVSLSIFLIISAIAFFYKPIYSVTYNGEFIGYCDNKSALQSKISEYIQSGNSDNVAFVQLDAMPEYELCLLKKGITPNDEEIYNKVTSAGTTYYRFYALVLDEEEKYYLSNFQDAESVVSQLKDKKSTNADSINIVEKYGTELKAFTGVEECVSGLYKKKVVSQPTYKKASSVSTSGVNSSSQKVNIGVSFINPTSGMITSRFGLRSRNYHTGLDIAASKGTPIYAASGGTIISAGNSGSGYGNMIIVSHGNGVQTYYAHLSAIYVSEGQTVSQGQHIAAMGSTGRSTGPHLHFEVRVNGVAQNPQNYVY